jgi:hypothetical protein
MVLVQPWPRVAARQGGARSVHPSKEGATAKRAVLQRNRGRAQEDLNPARGSVVHAGVRGIPCMSSDSSVRVLPNATKSSAVAIHVAIHHGRPGTAAASRRIVVTTA